MIHVIKIPCTVTVAENCSMWHMIFMSTDSFLILFFSFVAGYLPVYHV